MSKLVHVVYEFPFKDRRYREQKAYRDFLFGQMNEKKARNDHRRWQENLYLENRMLATNDRNDSIRKQVAAVDVNLTQQSQPKEPKNAELT